MTILSDVQLHLVETIDDVLKFREWLSSRRPHDTVSLDTESTGLDVRRDRVRLIQFGDEHHGWAMGRDEWLGAARDALRVFDGRVNMHNALFDRSIMKNSCDIDIPTSRIDDTMVMARVNEPHMSAALKSQATRHVDPAAAGLQAELKDTKWTWETVPVTYQPYWAYGALDPVLTQHLRNHHMPQVHAESPTAYDLEMATLWVVGRMQDNGICVNVSQGREILSKFTAYCDEVDRWCQDTYNVKPGSNAKVIQILESEGFTFTKATRSGAKSLDADVLTGIDHPLAQAVLTRRQLQKMATTYVSHYVTEADADWLLYPSINPLAARTSRMSMSSPNFQNLPRFGTTRAGDVVRDLVISRYLLGFLDEYETWDKLLEAYDPLKHGALMFCDFSQIEMRLLAHYANDPVMLAAFRNEGDFFVNLARQIFDDPTLVKSDPRRQVTKNAGYATIYGAGIPKFAATAGIDIQAARQFMARWNQLYPGVQQFQRELISDAVDRAKTNGEDCYVRSEFTNRRFVADDVRKAYVLMNYLIQGGAAELFKTKLLECAAAGLDEFMIAPVHDEILLDVPAEHVVDVAHTLQRIMNDDSMLRVPIQSEVSYGPTWGRKRSWESM